MKNSKKLARPHTGSGRSRILTQRTPVDSQSFSKSRHRTFCQPFFLPSARLRAALSSSGCPALLLRVALSSPNLYDSSPHAAPAQSPLNRDRQTESSVVQEYRWMAFHRWIEGRSCRGPNWCWLESLRGGLCSTNDLPLGFLLHVCRPAIGLACD